MVLKRVLSDEFDRLFNGTVILDNDIEDKLHIKHKVYRDDLENSLGDPYRVVLKPKQKSKIPTNQIHSSGKLYEVLSETSDGRVLFILLQHIGQMKPLNKFTIKKVRCSVMSKKLRQKIQVKIVNDASKLNIISKKELLTDSENYDKDNYNPLENLSEKEVLKPKNKSEVVTVRLSIQENKLISDLADENGLSKSSFIRMIVKRAIKEKVYK